MVPIRTLFLLTKMCNPPFKHLKRRSPLYQVQFRTYFNLSKYLQSKYSSTIPFICKATTTNRSWKLRLKFLLLEQ